MSDKLINYAKEHIDRDIEVWVPRMNEWVEKFHKAEKGFKMQVALQPSAYVCDILLSFWIYLSPLYREGDETWKNERKEVGKWINKVIGREGPPARIKKNINGESKQYVYQFEIAKKDDFGEFDLRIWLVC